MAHYFFTSESVTNGHPDKICDQISDAVLDAILEKDPNGRVACECSATTGLIMIMGEISTSAQIDIPAVARKVICDIGYDSSEKGFDGNTCSIITSINRQSADIALGVDRAGAGDQGMMFGYACDETPEYMPLAISLAHKLAARLTKVRVDGLMPYLRPDGKSQVTVEYDENGNAVRIDTVVISSQHSESVSYEKLRSEIIENVIKPVIPADMLDEKRFIISTPPVNSSSAAPPETADLRAEKSLWIPTADMRATAAGHSAEKTPPRLTAAPLMPRDMWQKISLRRVLPKNARSSSPTLSELPSLFLYLPKPTARALSPIRI